MTAVESGSSSVAAMTHAADNASKRQILRSLVSSPATATSLVFLVVLVILALGAGVISSHDPAAQELSERFQGVSRTNWLGTDEFGRDVLTRIMYAGRIALLAPLIAVGVAALIGIPGGLLAGMRRGKVDAVLSTVADTLLSVPALVFALAVISVLGSGLTAAMVAIGVMLSPHLYRIVRGATIVVAEETYISSADSIGSSPLRTMWKHVLPNIAAPVLVQVTLLMAVSLLAEAGLSFLGLGVQPPEASWGSMLKSAYENQFDAPWAVIAPGVAIVLTVLALNTLGDGLRDILAGGDSDG